MRGLVRRPRHPRARVAVRVSPGLRAAAVGVKREGDDQRDLRARGRERCELSVAIRRQSPPPASPRAQMASPHVQKASVAVAYLRELRQLSGERAVRRDERRGRAVADAERGAHCRARAVSADEHVERWLWRWPSATVGAECGVGGARRHVRWIGGRSGRGEWCGSGGGGGGGGGGGEHGSEVAAGVDAARGVGEAEMDGHGEEAAGELEEALEDEALHAHLPEAIRSNQKRSEATRSDQKRSEAIRGDQRRSEAIRSDQKRSEAIRGDQRQSEAITCSLRG